MVGIVWRVGLLVGGLCVTALFMTEGAGAFGLAGAVVPALTAIAALMCLAR